MNDSKLIVALTGPSGIGKTTLGDKLKERAGFIIPIHSTTRNRRNDDEIGFYRYLDHCQFNKYVHDNKFLFWSGDNDIVDKKYGNYYGILKDDYEQVQNYDRILFFISYKDLNSISNLINEGYNIKIINLIYSDLERNMPARLSDSNRLHTKQEIENRIRVAIQYENNYSQMLSSFGVLKLFGDLVDSDSIYDEVFNKVVKVRK